MLELIYTLNGVAHGSWVRPTSLCRGILLSVVLTCCYFQSVQAATLRLGQPTVEDDRISVAVLLECEAHETPAAIDFRLRYDPAVLRALGAEAGAQAQEAGKRLMANAPTEGHYVVLIMNFNQQTMAPGHVATLRLAQIGNSETGATQLQLTAPTLSTVEGVAIPVDGSEVSVLLAHEVPDEPKEPEADEPAADDAPPAPDGTAKAPGSPRLETNAPGDRMAGPAAASSSEDGVESGRLAAASALDEAERARSAIRPPAVLEQSPRPPAQSPAALSSDVEERQSAMDAPDTVDFSEQPVQDRDEREISKPEAEDGSALPEPGAVSIRTKRILMGVAAGVLVMLVLLRQRLVR